MGARVAGLTLSGKLQLNTIPIVAHELANSAHLLAGELPALQVLARDANLRRSGLDGAGGAEARAGGRHGTHAAACGLTARA